MLSVPKANLWSGNKTWRRLKYAAKCVPSYGWQRLTRGIPHGRVHLIIAVADHFEPSNIPGHDKGFAPPEVQDQRVDTWCREYPENFQDLRDDEGRPFTHTYFYPAEQYDCARVERLAELCRAGWGEIEIHLHHGIGQPATAEETRQQLTSFRDALASQHGCLAHEEGSPDPKYIFVHGNYALANSAGGHACGVDSEMQVLTETGCYADMTYPTTAFHPAQISKINSIYECALPLNERTPHRLGCDLRAGRAARSFPLLVQGPWMLDLHRTPRGRAVRIENGGLTGVNPPTLHRLDLWKHAAVRVKGRPDWIFIKLHTHGMDPNDMEVVLREPMRRFLREMIASASHRGEILHFVSAREMVNIVLAACDGREGNPGQFRDYRYRRFTSRAGELQQPASALAVKG